MSTAMKTTAPATAGVIEWAPFRLRDGVTEAALLEASDELQRDFLARQRGFVTRELLKGSDGGWADLVHWVDKESATAIMDAVASSPVCLRYFALMQGANHADPAAGVSHFRIVKPYRTTAG